MNPPALARILLFAVAGAAEFEFVEGDLREEFAILHASRGRPFASRWYWHQVLRSALTLFRLRIASGEFTRVFASCMAGVFVPLLLLDRLWCFVYSQIPLKDGLDRSPAMLVANLLCVCMGAAIAGSAVPTAATVVATPAAAAVALWAATGTAPAAYVVGILVGTSTSSLFLFTWRKSR